MEKTRQTNNSACHLFRDCTSKITQYKNTINELRNDITNPFKKDKFEDILHLNNDSGTSVVIDFTDMVESKSLWA